MKDLEKADKKQVVEYVKDKQDTFSEISATDNNFKDKLRNLKHFLRGFVFDARNPLSTISAYIDLIFMEISEESTIKHNIEEIRMANERLIIMFKELEKLI
jgi:hypothetical protein